MLHTLAVGNYRSINNLVMPLGRLNLITGANGSGKSNLYRALRLLAENKRRVNPLLEWRKDNSAMLLGSAL